MTATPIAELTPEQFNARFPVGTRVMAPGKLESGTTNPARACSVSGRSCARVGTGATYYTSELHPIATLGSLNVGDEFVQSEGDELRRVTHNLGGMVRSSDSNPVTGTRLFAASDLVQVIALNLAQDRPEVFPGTMLRDGDVVEFAPGEHGEKEVRVLNHFGPFVFKDGVLLDSSGDDGWIHDDAWNFRLVPATIPAPAPTEPCPAPVEETPEPQLCAECGAPENKYRTLTTNDIGTPMCMECYAFSDVPNGTFLPHKPPRELSRGAAYHLNDDCDASGLPGHH